MIVRTHTATIRETKPYEYLIRFLFGGIVTALAGIIAKHYGPVIGGFFLTFPAIFPASATLVAKHEQMKKEQKGLPGLKRGREAAALEALGTTSGSIGLTVFAGVVWVCLGRGPAWLILFVATLLWIVASIAIWISRKKL